MADPIADGGTPNPSPVTPVMPTNPLEGTTPPVVPAGGTPTPTGTVAAGESKVVEEQAPQGDAKTTVPETYDFKLPEGFTLAAEDSAKITEFGKSKQFSNSDMQSLIDMHVGKVTEIYKGIEAARVSEVTGWFESAKKDPELAGQAFNELAPNMETARQAYAKFATPELRAHMDKTGLGNHPEMLRMFLRIGKLTAEDTRVAESTEPTGLSESARKIFPSMSK